MALTLPALGTGPLLEALRRLRPSAADGFLLAWLVAMVIGGAGHPEVAGNRTIAALLALAVAATIVLASRGGPRWAAVHTLSPVVVVAFAFEATYPIVAAINPARWDAELLALDARFFPSVAEAWRQTLGRPAWLCDLASIAYVSWYVVPAAISVRLWLSPRHGGVEHYARVVVATFVLTWVGYLLVPASGPRIVDERIAAEVLGGGGISAWVRGFLARVDANALDAFPSGHTAIGLVYATCGGRLLPRWRVPLAAFAMSVIFSTVFLSWHYVIDLIAGALLAAAVLGVDEAFRHLTEVRSARLRPGPRGPGSSASL